MLNFWYIFLIGEGVVAVVDYVVTEVTAVVGDFSNKRIRLSLLGLPAAPAPVIIRKLGGSRFSFN
jgi:hypothetical protein